jgi:hypothetical protein
MYSFQFARALSVARETDQPDIAALLREAFDDEPPAPEAPEPPTAPNSWPCPCGCGRALTVEQLHGERTRMVEIEWSWHHEAALRWVAAHPGVPIQDAAPAAWLRAQSHADLVLWEVAERRTVEHGRVVYTPTQLGREFLVGRAHLPRSITALGHGRRQPRERVGESRTTISFGVMSAPEGNRK